jgi:hypothetical protein
MILDLSQRGDSSFGGEEELREGRGGGLVVTDVGRRSFSSLGNSCFRQVSSGGQHAPGWRSGRWGQRQERSSRHPQPFVAQAVTSSPPRVRHKF